MIIRTISTCIVDCDTCDETLGDVVEQSEAVVNVIAERRGWHANGDGKHACPRCMNATFQAQKPGGIREHLHEMLG